MEIQVARNGLYQNIREVILTAKLPQRSPSTSTWFKLTGKLENKL